MRRLRKNSFCALSNPRSTCASVPQKMRIKPRKRQATVSRSEEKKSISRVKNHSALDSSCSFAPALAGPLPAEPFTRLGGDSSTVVVLLLLTKSFFRITNYQLLITNYPHRYFTVCTNLVNVSFCCSTNCAGPINL